MKMNDRVPPGSCDLQSAKDSEAWLPFCAAGLAQASRGGSGLTSKASRDSRLLEPLQVVSAEHEKTVIIFLVPDKGCLRNQELSQIGM